MNFGDTSFDRSFVAGDRFLCLKYLYGSSTNNIKADAAIVLGAAVWGEEPSPVFRERINHAINLYKNDYKNLAIARCDNP